MSCSVLQCVYVAVCCSVLQCVELRCRKMRLLWDMVLQTPVTSESALRTVIMSHELCKWVTNYINESQTINASHKLCIWVTNYAYESRTMIICRIRTPGTSDSAFRFIIMSHRYLFTTHIHGSWLCLWLIYIVCDSYTLWVYYYESQTICMVHRLFT